MSEMVERLAKKINPWAFDPENASKVAPEAQNEARAMARDLIEAMREPTDEMLASLKEDWWDNETPLTVWQAMIDGALAKPAA